MTDFEDSVATVTLAPTEKDLLDHILVLSRRAQLIIFTTVMAAVISNAYLLTI